MYFIVIIVSDLWWQRGNRVCNNKKQWAFWKTVLYNGSCFLIRIKHLLSILWKLCFIHDLPILVFIIMSQPSLWFLWRVITLEPFGAFMVLSAYFVIVCLIVHLIYMSHFCGTRRLTALKHCKISNVSTKKKYILIHTRFSTPLHEVIGYIPRSDLEGWNRVWLTEKFWHLKLTNLWILWAESSFRTWILQSRISFLWNPTVFYYVYWTLPSTELLESSPFPHTLFLSYPF